MISVITSAPAAFELHFPGPSSRMAQKRPRVSWEKAHQQHAHTSIDFWKQRISGLFLLSKLFRCFLEGIRILLNENLRAH